MVCHKLHDCHATDEVCANFEMHGDRADPLGKEEEKILVLDCLDVEINNFSIDVLDQAIDKHGLEHEHQKGHLEHTCLLSLGEAELSPIWLVHDESTVADKILFKVSVLGFNDVKINEFTIHGVITGTFLALVENGRLQLFLHLLLDNLFSHKVPNPGAHMVQRATLGVEEIFIVIVKSLYHFLLVLSHCLFNIFNFLSWGLVLRKNEFHSWPDFLLCFSIISE